MAIKETREVQHLLDVMFSCSRVCLTFSVPEIVSFYLMVIVNIEYDRGDSRFMFANAATLDL
jgi:hypothetical protein